MNRFAKFLTPLCVLCLIVVGCAGSPAIVAPSKISTPSAYWPTENWRTSTPEEQGMDSQKLAQMLATIKEKKINLHSLLVIRHGYIVSETYFGTWEQGNRHNPQSVGRSWTATLVGIAIDKGYIDGTAHRILDYFPDRTFANLDPQKQAMTLDDVLTMRSGLEGLVGDDRYAAMQASPDWIQFLLDRKMVAPPGTKWKYCAGCSHLLTVILQKTTGMNPRDFAEEYLFKPLGISLIRWTTDPQGIPFGAGGFGLTPREMAKLGYLYLRKGQWDGQQLVSARWIERATQEYAKVDVDPHFGYGYHWFTISSMAGYAALGDGGQIILVIPGSDLIVVTTAETNESLFELIDQYVLPSVRE
ncbi:MAG: serine hydrolase [Chloroflexi bacterium]|nr:serine hydrolase [Chloroflexota bacterium]